MAISMTESMSKTLDGFFATKTINDVDRSTFLVCNLQDPRIKVTISLVFMKDWDTAEYDNYTTVILENKGAVFTFPCYWVSIPKELAIAYFECIINDFYKDEISQWSIAQGIVDDSANSDNGSNNCNCGCEANKKQITDAPCQYIAQNI